MNDLKSTRNACLLATLLSITATMITGCGKPPPPAGGPPGDFAVNAVIAQAVAESVPVAVQLVGSLQARDTLDLVSEINAPVSEVLFTDGDEVNAGQALVQLDDSKLSAQYKEAEARFSLAETNFKRNRELLKNQTISQQEFDQSQAEFSVAEATLALLASDLEDAVIQAPFAGVVSEKMVSPGEYLTVGRPVTRLVRLDPLEVAFQVPERYAGMLATGQSINLRTVAFPDREITGTVFFVDTVLDQSTRTVLAKAEIANPDHRLKPGMFGTLNLILAVREDAVVVPESAIRYSGDQATVVVMNSEDAAEFRPVTVGERLTGRGEISQGLEAGERVVVEGFQKMGPGTKILISPKSEAYGVKPPESQP